MPPLTGIPKPVPIAAAYRTDYYAIETAFVGDGILSDVPSVSLKQVVERYNACRSRRSKCWLSSVGRAVDL